MTNDKYFTFDMLFDLSDLKNLDKKIDEKVVKYLSDEQDLFTDDLAVKMFILRDFHDEIIDASINLS